MKNDLLILDPVQEMAARAIWLIEHNDPKCPACGAGVLRPKCLEDRDYDSCPRHEIADRIKHVVLRLEDMGRLKSLMGWRYKASLMQIIGPPSKEDIKTLKWLVKNGKKFKSPKHTNTFDSLALQAAGHWSSQYSTWTFELSDRGEQYLQEAEK